MIWLGLFFVIIGYIIYRADKNFKTKFEDKFNPQDWQLPINDATPDASGAPSAAQSNAVQKASIIAYEKKDSLLSPAERLLFDALQSALAMEYQLLTKIAVADCIKIKTSSENVSPNPLIEKQFDFVVCDKSTFGLLCVIEFNEKNSPVFSDAVLSAICRSAQLPLLSISRELKYNVPQLRTQLLTAIGLIETEIEQAQKIVAVVANKNIDQTVVNTAVNTMVAADRMVANACPKCSAVMVQRKAKNLAQEEKLFWVCTRYPECRGRVAVAG